MMLLRLAALVLVSSMLAIGCTPTPPDGRFACVTNAECPFGFPCVGGRCRNGIGTECQRDIDCEFRSACTIDTCEGGYCVFAPDTTQDGFDCDDGTVCNGPERCLGGACRTIGVTPCPGQCNETVGCPDCGRLGQECCPLVLEDTTVVTDCFDGSLCDAFGQCVACGAPGGPCCDTIFPPCGPGTGCTNVDDPGAGTCDPCGDVNQPCCIEGEVPEGGLVGMTNIFCTGTGLVCNDAFRCVPCGHEGESACQDGCGPDLYVGASGVCRYPGTDCAECGVSEVCTEGGCETPGVLDGPCYPGNAECVAGVCFGSCSEGTCVFGRCDLFAEPGTL